MLAETAVLDAEVSIYFWTTNNGEASGVARGRPGVALRFPRADGASHVVAQPVIRDAVIVHGLALDSFVAPCAPGGGHERSVENESPQVNPQHSKCSRLRIAIADRYILATI
jgi:hypothetical protein